MNLPGEGFELDGWTVLPSLGRIVRGQRTVHIQPKLMDALVYMAERQGELVTKQEIIDAVWKQEFVANAVLTRAISELRKALGDDGAERRYIETIPKRGYRLIAEVRFEVQNAGQATGEDPPLETLLARSDEPLVLGPDVRCCLVYGGELLPLADGDYIIGRGLDASVAVRKVGVSRHHALIAVRSGTATIEDLASKNGTIVSGTRIDGRVTLCDGDRISIGDAYLFYRDLTNLTTRGSFTGRTDR